MSADTALIRWASRVNPRLIERVYANDAAGIHDIDLVNEAGYALLARCRSIMAVDAANRGRFTCPRCEATWEQGSAWDRFDRKGVVCCPACAWSVTWDDFMRTYQHKHLGTGGAGAFHREFVERFPSARTYHEKLIAIDRLIHCFHWELISGPGRPGARELLYAKNNVELMTFLDRLTYGERTSPSLRETRAQWERKVDASKWLQMTGFGPRPRRREGD